MADLYLSPQHGVNPSVQRCFLCQKDVGVVLFGKMKGDAEAPRHVVLEGSPPCDECLGHMEQGVILISVDEALTDDPKDPYRTGGWVVVRDGFVERNFSPPALVKSVLEARLAFVTDQVWNAFGLPRGSEASNG